MDQSKGSKFNRKTVFIIMAVMLVVAFSLWYTANSALDNVFDPTQNPESAAEVTVPAAPKAFSSPPSVAARDCILQAAKIEELLSDYDQLDKDFLIIYASQLSFEEFANKTKGTKTYSDDLSPADMKRLQNEVQFNRECRLK
ncbi:hypothetical protein [Kordiimonas sp. SCSIO 12610]|uniref:hypothetical protein n=1 Tax=Kordiimonas sp. SCSIO 12610 TaxID=2829597 RepID=UPI00210E3775|nr:hypothetical protein [Kordiimonas sp. SCSIO 12610]UTW54395.1 hypothetical protein KFF44_11275 [Kordiimonas sp. SCSIO 12610]